MAERENLPAKLAAQDLAATTEKRGSLVGRGMAAVEHNKKLALTKNNDVLYRQAREVYDQLFEDGRPNVRVGTEESESQMTAAFDSFQQLAEKGYGKAYFPLYNIYSGNQPVKADPVQAARYHKLAFDWLHANQYLKDPETWHDLGNLYLFLSEDVEDNIESAINWFLKAAEAGHVNSMWMLICAGGFMDGWESTLYWEIKAAEAGHEEVQLMLKMQHDRGDLNVDDEQVFNWYIWSAEHDHVWAQLFLAEAYLYDVGIEQDDEKAVYWFRKAAEQGNVGAQILLVSMYEYGRGVDQSDEQTAYWFRNVGICYRYGDDGTQADDDKARRYFLLAVNLYREAAESGEGWGQFGLGMCYGTGHGVVHDDRQAVYWLRKAAVQGDGSGQHALGDMYKSGRGVAQDDEQAVCWFRKSAEQGNELGQLKLGLSYKTGRGVAQDNEQAMYWFSKAAEQGHPLAKAALKNLDFD